MQVEAAEEMRAMQERHPGGVRVRVRVRVRVMAMQERHPDGVIVSKVEYEQT